MKSSRRNSPLGAVNGVRCLSLLWIVLAHTYGFGHRQGLDQRASRKMTTSKQKVFCVLRFAKKESAITVQRAFRINKPPNDNNILRQYQQSETTGCFCKGKSTG
ncbi:hypothetical protein TNCV_3208531 [Trichonephila clavipes]|nr:hypothetical protein TNCV_3208531 [Trichonephila clavipes]